jgi:hypothetical protein
MKRGLILPTLGQSSRNDLHLDGARLRHLVLFWDRFSVPTIETGSQTVDDETLRCLADLSAAGLIETINWEEQTYGSPLIEDRMWPLIRAGLYFSTLKMCEDSEPGVWSLGVSQTLRFGNAIPLCARSLVFQMVNLLPVPTNEVPLQTILEFKEARRPELLALRVHLEEIFERVVSSLDVSLAATREVAVLRNSIGDLCRTLDERGLRYRWGGIEAKVVIEAQAASIASGAALATLGGPFWGAIGALVGALKVEVGSALNLKRRDGAVLPFEYVIQAHRQLQGPNS